MDLVSEINVYIIIIIINVSVPLLDSIKVSTQDVMDAISNIRAANSHDFGVRLTIFQ